MTETRCDRCDASITTIAKRELTTVDSGGNVETLVADLCPRCIASLKAWCSPLPREAKS